MISNLPADVLEEILCRVPLKTIKAVRLTCKRWKILSKDDSFSKKHIAKATRKREGESTMIRLMNYNLRLTSVVLRDPYRVEHRGKLNEQVKISSVYHCEGLLLCILKDDDTKLLVVNPYLGETRWIQPRVFHLPKYGYARFNYALGYSETENRRSFKILRFVDYFDRPENQFFWYEIYDFDSGLWTNLDAVNPQWFIASNHRGYSLKGNTYWVATERNDEYDPYYKDHIICFDFTTQRFGSLLHLPDVPVNKSYDYVTLSCVGEEKLAALFQYDGELDPEELEIWITTTIDPETVSWAPFLRILKEPFGRNKIPLLNAAGFLIDEEKKLAMGFTEQDRTQFVIIGETEYYRGLYVVERGYPEVCSYVPSLVQIKKPNGGEREEEQSSVEENRRFQKRLDAFFNY